MSARQWRFGAALGAVLVGAVLTTNPAAAVDQAGSLTVRSIDAASAPTIHAVLQYTGPLTDATVRVTVREDGRLVPKVEVVPVSATAVPIGVVVVLDTSGSMRSSGRIDAAKAAVHAFVAGRGANERIALVTFSDSSVVAHGFSADGGAADAVDPLVASGETALWDAIRSAIGLFGDNPGMQPNVLVLSDGTDSVSKASASDAKSAALAAHVPISAIGLTGPGFDGAELASLASNTGGRFLAATSSSDLSGLFGQIRRDLNQQFEVTWAATSPAPHAEFQLDGATASALVPTGGSSQGSQTSPQLISGGHGVMNGAVGLAAAIGLTAAAGIGLAIGGVYLLRMRKNPLALRLAPYGEAKDQGGGTRASDGSVASTDVVRRAVALTEAAGSNLGLFGWLEERLEVARLPIRPAEAAFFTLAFALVAGIGNGFLNGPVLGILTVIGVIGFAFLGLSFAAARKRKKFVKQLPTTLQLLASSLRAGYSLMQGCESVAQEIGGPMGLELKRVLSEARLGRPIEDALEHAAERTGSADFAWVVMAISIQREVGGNLAELLDTVADTMRARARLRGEVKALTAEGRVSALMLGFMPPALAAAMAVMSPGYLNPLFTQSTGRVLLGGSILGIVLGFLWMQKIIKVEA